MKKKPIFFGYKFLAGYPYSSRWPCTQAHSESTKWTQKVIKKNLNDMKVGRETRGNVMRRDVGKRDRTVECGNDQGTLYRCMRLSRDKQTSF